MTKVAVRGAFAIFYVFMAGLVGCGTGVAPTAVQSVTSGPVAASAGVTGSVYGGSQPISGATVQLWTVGTTGYGSTGSVVVGTTTTGGGSFTLPSYTCSPATELVYLTATGGNPGITATTQNPSPNNAAISLMAALGPCTGLTSGTHVNIDEATTVASVYALAQFMSGSGSIGSYGASTVGIANAFATVNNLVSTSGGYALAMTPAGNGVVPTAEIDTLANILASCVNSPGGTAGQNNACGNLFTATTHGSSVPANTLQAILNIALHPADNPSGQYGLVSTNGPFQPTLSGAPNDWTMAVEIAGTGAYPSDMAIDASGNIWVANYGGTNTYGGTSEVSNLGAIFPGAPYSQSTVGIGAIAIDLSGNAWVANTANAEFLEIAPGGAYTNGPFQLPETNQPEAIAVDGNNNVWITNGSGGNGSGSVSELSNRGGSSQVLSPSGGYTGGGLNFPVGIAIDASNNAWIADVSGNALTEISSTGSVSGGYTGTGLNQPAIVATDGSGHLWVENNNVNAVAEFNGSGTEIDPGGSGITGGGITAGGGLSVDGGGNIWIADANGNALSEVNSSGAVISPANGYLGASRNLSTGTNCKGKAYSGGNLNYPYATRVDSSGNVWVINYCEVQFSSSFYAGLTEFIGLGTPTIQPLAAAVQQGLIGQRPGTSPGTTLTVTSNSLPAGVQTGKYSYQLLAKGGTGNGYTWTVTSGGSTLSSLGLSLSTGGLLSGTLSGTVSGASIGFKVTDSGGSTATATLSLTVNAVQSLSITTTDIASGTVGTNYNQLFTATGGSGNYTWTIPNTNGQLSALNAEGLGYETRGGLGGTPTASGSFPFTMQVTDLATGQTASAPFTLVVNGATLSQCTHDGSGNAILNGHYAFLLSGFDGSGNVLDQIGSFQADGAGTISNGLGDSNSSGNATAGEQSYTFAGTYSIGSTDDRGQMVIHASNNTSTQYFCFAADTVTNGVAYSGRVIDASGDGSIQTGVFQIQNPNDFSNAGLTGGYVFGVQGVNGGTPLARGGLVGQLTLNGSGGVSGGQVDVATYKSNAGSTDYTSALALTSGTYTMGSGGRGTLTVSGGQGGATFIVYQFGNGSGFFMLSSANVNSNTLLTGYAMQQTQTSFTTANVAAKGVFREDGLLAGNGADNMQIGQIGTDGSGNLTYISDTNDAGSITAPSGVLTANYTVTSLGYLKIANAGGNTPNFYLYAPGGGFGLDASNVVGLWVMVPQTVPNGGFTSASVSGAYALGTVPSAGYSTTGAGTTNGAPYPELLSAEATFSAGSVSIIEDSDEPPGTIPWITTGQTGTNAWALDSTYGPSYGRMTIVGSGGTTGLVGYIVSPAEFFLLSVTSGKDGTLYVLDHQ